MGKKLSKMQGELNAVAASLGAEFRYLAHFLVNFTQTKGTVGFRAFIL